MDMLRMMSLGFFLGPSNANARQPFAVKYDKLYLFFSLSIVSCYTFSLSQILKILRTHITPR
ncbi:hypothetical protein ACE6H2_011676 [Prunus campanulata]